MNDYDCSRFVEVPARVQSCNEVCVTQRANKLFTSKTFPTPLCIADWGQNPRVEATYNFSAHYSEPLSYP